jgi:transposase
MPQAISRRSVLSILGLAGLSLAAATVLTVSPSRAQTPPEPPTTDRGTGTERRVDRRLERTERRQERRITRAERRRTRREGRRERRSMRREGREIRRDVRHGM